MKKTNKILKLIPTIGLIGSMLSVCLTSCNNGGEQTTYTVSYGSTPAGLTWRLQPTEAKSGTDFVAKYSLTTNYSICNSVIKVDNNDISKFCTVTKSAITIPAAQVKGNISINLSTYIDTTTKHYIFYTNPTGLQWTTKPTNVSDHVGVSAEYTLSNKYMIDTELSDILVGSKSIKNKISYDSGSVNIPANLVTSDISIQLVTKIQDSFTAAYGTDPEGLNWIDKKTSATLNQTFKATYSLKSGKVMDVDNCTATVDGNDITQYVTFGNGTIIVPGEYVTGDLEFTLATKDEKDTSSYSELSGGEITSVASTKTSGLMIHTLKADTSNAESMDITLTGTWLKSQICIATPGTYNITLNNCNISNINPDTMAKTDEPVINITGDAAGAIVNIILADNTENTINDKRSSITPGYYKNDFVIRHNGVGGQLNFKGNGILGINNVNNNIGGYTKGIQTKCDVNVTNNATLNVFSYDTSIQVGGKLTINNANVVANSYCKDAIKNKALDPNEDLPDTGATKNINRDIVIVGKSIVNTYSARNGFNAEHDFITQADENGSPIIKTYTGYENAGIRVNPDDEIDEQNMYIAIPSSLISSSPLESFYYTIDFYKDSSSTEIDHTECLSLKKIHTQYFFKCDRPLDGTCGAFKINKFAKDQYGLESPTAIATSDFITIPYPSQLDKYDCAVITEISGQVIKTSSKQLFYNYNTLIHKQGSKLYDETIPAKGIKAKNNINLTAGNISLATLDTCISSTYGEIFCNSSTSGDITFGAGDISIDGATVIASSTESDGIKTYGTINIIGGTTNITKSVEALEAGVVNIKGGIIKLAASDDGINASCIGKYTTDMLSINISGGVLDVQTDSSIDTDAIDSNNTMTITGGLIIARAVHGTAIDTNSKIIPMSNATLIAINTVETQIQGPNSTLLYNIGEAQSYTVTYYTSSSTTNTYTFTNNVQFANKASVYYNYNVPTIE